MNAKIRMSLVLLMLVAILVPTQAQQGPRGNRGPRGQRPGVEQCERQVTPKEMCKIRAERMAKELNLSADKKAELEMYFLAQLEKQKKNREATAEERKACQAQSEAELTKIIGEENMAKLDELRNNKEGKRRGPRKGPKGPAAE